MFYDDIANDHLYRIVYANHIVLLIHKYVVQLHQKRFAQIVYPVSNS